MLYVIYVHTTFYDLDTHYDDQVLGIFDNEDLAEKALESIKKEYIDEKGRWRGGAYADDFEFSIQDYALNKTIYEEEDDDG